MNTLTTTFTYENQNIRTAGTPDHPLFCIQDVCTVLDIKNSANKTALLDADEKDTIETLDSIGRRRNKPFCTEPGLYKIIFSMQDKPQTKPFKHWVCHEVLPSIRKTGQYQVQQNIMQLTYENKMRELDIREAELVLKQDESKRLNLESARSVLSPTDARAQQKLADYALNRVLAITDGTEEQEELLGVTEILEETGLYNQKTITKNAGALGRRVAEQWKREHGGEDPQKSMKYCNGHRCHVGIYPRSYSETIIREFTDLTRGIRKLAKGQTTLPWL